MTQLPTGRVRSGWVRDAAAVPGLLSTVSPVGSNGSDADLVLGFAFFMVLVNRSGGGLAHRFQLWDFLPLMVGVVTR